MNDEGSCLFLRVHEQTPLLKPSYNMGIKL